MFEAYPSPFAPLPGTTPSPRGLFIDPYISQPQFSGELAVEEIDFPSQLPSQTAGERKVQSQAFAEVFRPVAGIEAEFAVIQLEPSPGILQPVGKVGDIGACKDELILLEIEAELGFQGVDIQPALIKLWQVLRPS